MTSRMRNSELADFVSQLNNCLQTTDDVLWAESVCHLYGSYTGAGALLANRAGETVAQVFGGEGSGKFCLTLPVCYAEAQIGALNVYHSRSIDENEKTAARIICGLFTVMLVQMEAQASRERKRRQDAVRAVINTLSFSELEAASHIIKTLGGNDGLLVAARVADGLGITRSVVVNALRKLEGAGMLETRSLGMKGTYIRLKDELLVGELGKIT